MCGTGVSTSAIFVGINSTLSLFNGYVVKNENFESMLTNTTYDQKHILLHFIFSLQFLFAKSQMEEQTLFNNYFVLRTSCLLE